ncbi:cupin domain-containing protein [Paraburkholderia pallida]|uniref:Cupin domain-containing protein n=1 Tax=Paraburkholderia pallida TaxID=2547399 RepID=A0A4V1B0S1_9BURK|nr:cupin domain-containing protein [Paraburkholderia pallida]QBR03753.1 cupin domain-containing protein [Paraburkholderia pallida]
MTLPVRWVSRGEMLGKYVAHFGDLRGSDTGLPDSAIPGHYKKILNVFGFDPPQGDDAVNPVGDDAHALIRPQAGFSLGFLKTTPGNGPVIHNHNTNETFMPLGGTWRFIWESGPDHTEFVDLEPYDVISFPPGVPRRFENLKPTRGEAEGLLLAIVAGDAPVSEAMPGVTQMFKDLASGAVKVLSDDGQSVLLTSSKGGFGG